MIVKLLWGDFPFHFHHRALLVDSNWNVTPVVESKMISQCKLLIEDEIPSEF